ncbi:Hypothetical protein NTJ_04116 [Nesidiocoris tenuis]|uniref:Uncharacterized protein n=1 Tax=Nesidiocoris tenuis TaxID=355587 RepID=A0ABN7AH00_9HEMI|nr:Hypothetical protein NTJ_04116 [Nesidiocoris tenuis]
MFPPPPRLVSITAAGKLPGRADVPPSRALPPQVVISEENVLGRVPRNNNFGAIYVRRGGRVPGGVPGYRLITAAELGPARGRVPSPIIATIIRCCTRDP